MVLAALTLLVGWFLLLPAAYADLGKSAVYQAAFAANIHFWLDSGYFAAVAEEKPLLHPWSLAVEEQFYPFVPVILSMLSLKPAFRRRGELMSLFLAGIAISFAGSIYGVQRHPGATFYLLPTRAWELLVGSTIAILPTARALNSSLLRELASYLGLAGILVPCFLYNRLTPFPGMAALPPCLGTALVIWANTRVMDEIPPTSIGRFLATAPVVFVGLISYSLYLWHWPLFAFSAISAWSRRNWPIAWAWSDLDSCWRFSRGAGWRRRFARNRFVRVGRACFSSG